MKLKQSAPMCLWRASTYVGIDQSRSGSASTVKLMHHSGDSIIGEDRQALAAVFSPLQRHRQEALALHEALGGAARQHTDRREPEGIPGLSVHKVRLEPLVPVVVGDPGAPGSKLGVSILRIWACVPVMSQESSEGSKEAGSASAFVISSLIIVVSAVGKRAAAVGLSLYELCSLFSSLSNNCTIRASKNS